MHVRRPAAAPHPARHPARARPAGAGARVVRQPVRGGRGDDHQRALLHPQGRLLRLRGRPRDVGGGDRRDRRAGAGRPPRGHQGPAARADLVHGRRGADQRPAGAGAHAVAARGAAGRAGALRALGGLGAAGRDRPAGHGRSRRAVQGLPARRDQHRDRARLGLRRRGAGDRRVVGLRLGLRAQRRLHRLRRLEHHAPARPAVLRADRGRAPDGGAARLALRRSRRDHRPVRGALLRDGHRARALHLPAHRGAAP